MIASRRASSLRADSASTMPVQQFQPIDTYKITYSASEEICSKFTFFFRGVLCDKKTDPSGKFQELKPIDLFDYQDSEHRENVIRFDPTLFPVRGGLDGIGGTKLIARLQNAYVGRLNLKRGKGNWDLRCNKHRDKCAVRIRLRTDVHSHYVECGLGEKYCFHNHAEIIEASKHRKLPRIATFRESSPDRVVIVQPKDAPAADVAVGSTMAVDYPARIVFKAAPCLLDAENYEFERVELFSYTHPAFKHMMVRFDPIEYPLKGGFDGPGWKQLLEDLKKAADDPLILFSTAKTDTGKLRRLHCRRGEKHNAKHVIQECNCPVQLEIRKDSKTFYLKCGVGGSMHRGHPPLSKGNSLQGVAKSKTNLEGSLAGRKKPNATNAAMAPSAPADFSKSRKRLPPHLNSICLTKRARKHQQHYASSNNGDATSSASCSSTSGGTATTTCSSDSGSGSGSDIESYNSDSEKECYDNGNDAGVSDSDSEYLVGDDE